MDTDTDTDTDTKPPPLSSPAGTALRKTCSPWDFVAAGRAVLRYASPTVNKISSLRDFVQGF